MKRLMDLLGSIVALIIFLPLMIIIALLIRLTDSGPVIFKQKRLGRYGKEFTMYKFRSMVVNAEEILKNNSSLYAEYVNNSFCINVNKDPRVTRIGKYLRKTSLDELPQFFNVLQGDMSLVGPRPIVKEELKHYVNQAADFLNVKPGVTGYWQVSGRDDIPYPERVEVEMYYVQNHTIWFDLKIILKTAVSVFQRKRAPID